MTHAMVPFLCISFMNWCKFQYIVLYSLTQLILSKFVNGLEESDNIFWRCGFLYCVGRSNEQTTSFSNRLDSLPNFPSDIGGAEGQSTLRANRAPEGYSTTVLVR
jgi:hypothetical protein